MTQKILTTQNANETKVLGKEFAHSSSVGTVLALHGDLGSGKTTFVQGLAEGLGLKKNITSPTFLIQKSYQISDTQTLYHLDLYRLQNEKEAESIGVNDLFSQSTDIIVIEWPEKIASILPENTVHLYFEYLDENKRQIKIEK